MNIEMTKSYSSWEKVKIARHKDRPNSVFYIKNIFSDFLEFHGDRIFGDDKAIIGGIGFLDKIPVTVVAITKGSNTTENIMRNFGMPKPEGYRKALRIMKLAEKFNRPIICFVDTPGAYCGIEAEERGQGESIAKNLFEMSSLKVPVLAIMIGEGGSGGALALAVANKVWMLENATYSILSPEGFASILWKDAKKAEEAAKAMKITASDLKELGVIDKVILEEEPAQIDTIYNISDQMREGIEEFLAEYQDMEKDAIVKERYDKFRAF